MKLFILAAALVALAIASPTCGACLYNYQYACVNDLHAICVDIPEVGLPTCPMPEMDLITDIDDCPVEPLGCPPYVDPSPEPCCDKEGVECSCECEQIVTPLPFCYQPPTEDRTGGVVFTYETTEDAFIPVNACYNHVSGLVDAGQPSHFLVANNGDPAFYINFPIDRTYVTWTVGDLSATVDHTDPPLGLPVCDDFCTGDCETCSQSAAEYGIHCLWCPDEEAEDPATEGECLSNFGPEEPEDICDDPRYGEEPDCIFNTTGPVCDLIEECGECADSEGCVWCNADCGCIYEEDVEVECLQYDVPGVVVEESADCRVTDAGDYVDVCAGIDEQEALLALYNATNGPAWTNNTGWDGADICLFYGVDCAAKTLDLSNNNLDGVLPDEFFCISSFQLVDLSHNDLRGCIPDAIGSMTGVQSLHLEYNELTCDIPHTIALGLAVSLKYLYLQFNFLGCPIPEEFCLLIYLQEFHLEVNWLRDDIPVCISTPDPFSELFEAHFECNHLTEPYPGYLDDLRAGITKYGGGTIYSVPPLDLGLWDSENKVWVPCPVFEE